MIDQSPAKRTAVTARFLLAAGVLAATEALWRGSVTRTLVAACLLIAVPGLLFSHPDQRVYFFFASQLRTDASSFVPVVLGLCSLVAVLRLPLHAAGPGRHA